MVGTIAAAVRTFSTCLRSTFGIRLLGMTEELHPLEQAIACIGLARLARELALTPPALRKWQRAGRLPRTEWTGETSYAEKISALCEGSPSIEQLKGPWPKWETARPKAPAPGAPAIAASQHAAASGGNDKPLELAERRAKQIPIRFADRRDQTRA